MKKILALALALTLVLALTGCVGKEQTQDVKPSEPVKQPAGSIAPSQSVPDSTEPSQNPSVDFETTVSWVNYSDDVSKLYMSALNNDKMMYSSVRHLPIYKCSSAEDLEKFKSDFSDILDFSAQYDGVESFDETGKKYDTAFFEKNTLLLIYITAGSGSYRYGVDSIYVDSDNVAVHIKQVNEVEVGTCDMAGWLICISVSKDAIKTCTVFNADLI